MPDEDLTRILRLSIGWFPPGVFLRACDDTYILVHSREDILHIMCIREVMCILQHKLIFVEQSDWEHSPNPYIRYLHDNSVDVSLQP